VLLSGGMRLLPCNAITVLQISYVTPPKQLNGGIKYYSWVPKLGGKPAGLGLSLQRDLNDKFIIKTVNDSSCVCD
jgi:hypothetical protein